MRLRVRGVILVLSLILLLGALLLWGGGDGGLDAPAHGRGSDATQTPPPALAAGPRPKPEPDPAAATPVDAPVVGRLRGFVRSADGKPVAGAAVRITVVRGHGEVETALATSDAQGAYGADLPGLVALDADAWAVCVISVTARITGREMGQESLALEARRRDDLRIDVTMGDVMPQSILGRVLGVDGTPARDIAVTVCADGRPVGSAQTDADGRFAFAIAKPGVYVVEALDPGQGYARSAAEEVAAAATLDVKDLRLSAASVIEGRVELPDGTLPPPVDISVVSADAGAALVGGCDASGAPAAVYVQSTRDGRFIVRGLRPGRYRLRALGEPDVGKDKQTNVVETDARGVVLVVNQRFVVVHVVDAAGKPFEGASCSYEEVRDDPENGATGVGDFSREGGTHVFQFDRPVALRVDISAGAMQADMLQVEVPMDRWVVETTAVLRPRASHGTIRLDLVDADRKPISRFRAEAWMLFDGRRSGLVGYESWTSREGLVSRPLRPGRYTVAVTPGIEDKVPGDLGGPCFGLQRVEVAVPPGGEILARVVAQPGGWLRVKLVTPDGKEGVRSGYSIKREGRDTDPPIWAMWSDPERAGQWHSLQSGKPQIFAQPLEPGRYVLTASAVDLPETKTPFEIRAGSTTDVEVRFSPK